MNLFNYLPYPIRFKLGCINMLSSYIFWDDEAILAKLRRDGMVDIINGLSASERRLLHFNFGREIRNTFLLWHPNNPFTMRKLNALSEEHKAGSPFHPDNYSWSIISRLIVDASPQARTSSSFDVAESLIYSLLARADDDEETLEGIESAVESLVAREDYDLLDDVFAETIQFNPSPEKLRVLLNGVAGHTTHLTPVNYLRVAQRAVSYGITIPKNPNS